MMTRALVFKELRESAGLIAVALLLEVYFLAGMTGFPLLPPWLAEHVNSLPFIHDGLSRLLAWLGGALAVLLGLKQTAWEAHWGTYYFLGSSLILVGKLCVTRETTSAPARQWGRPATVALTSALRAGRRADARATAVGLSRIPVGKMLKTPFP